VVAVSIDNNDTVRRRHHRGISSGASAAAPGTGDLVGKQVASDRAVGFNDRVANSERVGADKRHTQSERSSYGTQSGWLEPLRHIRATCSRDAHDVCSYVDDDDERVQSHDNQASEGLGCC
jgi:hypothetical protein